jgi:hypothetical protein
MSDIKPVWQHLGSMVESFYRFHQCDRPEYVVKVVTSIDDLCREFLPSGSGFNNGTQWVEPDHWDTKPSIVKLKTAFHHMNETGCYDGWTDHQVKFWSTLGGSLDLVVTGKDRNGIKDYIGDTFHDALCVNVEMVYNTETKETEWKRVENV